MHEVSRLGNIRRFIWFRVLFSARFYYPVFSIFFLDLGITLETFAYLNLIWALTIVAFEVPSGALADVVGRKKFILFGSVLYVFEMLLLLIAPVLTGAWLMIALVTNRIFSGLAEATISGADEALAYESLVEIDCAHQWPRVLEGLQKWTSGGFFVALILGGALYDATFINNLLSWSGFVFEQSLTMRFPIFAGLLCSLLALACAWGMREPQRRDEADPVPSLTTAWAGFRQAFRWFVNTRVAFVIILSAVAVDNIIRIHLTTYSNYLTAIGYTPASFGVISASLSVVTVLMAWWPRRLVHQQSAARNFMLVHLLTLAGLCGIALLLPFWGVVFLVFIRLAMANLYFFLSHYINLLADSTVRATILSLRSVLMNFGYAIASLLFAILGRHISHQLNNASEQLVYEKSVAWFPWYFAILMMLIIVITPWILGSDKTYYKNDPQPGEREA